MVSFRSKMLPYYRRFKPSKPEIGYVFLVVSLNFCSICSNVIVVNCVSSFLKLYVGNLVRDSLGGRLSVEDKYINLVKY